MVCSSVTLMMPLKCSPFKKDIHVDLEQLNQITNLNPKEALC